jgi:hypothetical protein
MTKQNKLSLENALESTAREDIFRGLIQKHNDCLGFLMAYQGLLYLSSIGIDTSKQTRDIYVRLQEIAKRNDEPLMYKAIEHLKKVNPKLAKYKRSLN